MVSGHRQKTHRLQRIQSHGLTIAAGLTRSMRSEKNNVTGCKTKNLI